MMQIPEVWSHIVLAFSYRSAGGAYYWEMNHELNHSFHNRIILNTCDYGSFQSLIFQGWFNFWWRTPIYEKWILINEVPKEKLNRMISIKHSLAICMSSKIQFLAFFTQRLNVSNMNISKGFIERRNIQLKYMYWERRIKVVNLPLFLVQS